MSRFTFFFLVLFSFQWAICAEQQRGLWVVRHALNENHDISNILETALKLDVTDIYLQVRALGKKFYVDYSAPPRPLPKIVKLIDDAGHHNIRVHAWINIMYIWAGSSPPVDKDHILLRSPNSVLRKVNQDGIPPYNQLRKASLEGYFIHPYDAQHLNEITHTIDELLDVYAFDGVHLDYFRLPSLEYSFSPLGRTRFLQHYFIDPMKMYKDTERFIDLYGRDVFLETDLAYKTFIREELTRSLETIRNHIKTLNPAIVLSIAVKPDPIRAKHYFYQDWKHWLSQGLCDQVLIMNYTPDFREFKRNLSSADHTGFADRIVVGLATYNQNIREVKRRIFMVEHLPFAGIAIFSYNHLFENAHYLNSLSLRPQNGEFDVKNDTRTKGN